MRAAALVAVVALAGAAGLAPAHADPIDAVIRARVAPALPAGAGIAELHLPRVLVGLDVAPDAVVVTVRSQLKVGRPSIQVAVARVTRRPVWVPITIGALTTVAIATRAIAVGETIAAADVRIDQRAGSGDAAAVDTVVGATATRELAAGDAVAATAIALPAPVARGTEVDVVARRGAVRIHGRGVLERAARPGDEVAVRLVATHAVARGTLISATTLEIGGSP